MLIPRQETPALAVETLNHGPFDLSSDNAVLVFAKTGLRVPLIGAFDLTAQVDFDYDSEPAPGVDSTDIKYILSLGYEW